MQTSNAKRRVWPRLYALTIWLCVSACGSLPPTVADCPPIIAPRQEVPPLSGSARWTLPAESFTRQLERILFDLQPKQTPRQ